MQDAGEAGEVVGVQKYVSFIFKQELFLFLSHFASQLINILHSTDM